MPTVREELERFRRTESQLTMNMMERAIGQFNVTDPDDVMIVYSTVIHYTGRMEGQGWGTSDTSILMNAVERDLKAAKAQEKTDRIRAMLKASATVAGTFGERGTVYALDGKAYIDRNYTTIDEPIDWFEFKQAVRDGKYPEFVSK